MIAQVENHPATQVAAPISLAKLRKAAKGCTACPLYRNATQTVFGEGAAHARVMFVGEQPGDQEDVAGRPFVGPAGQIFNRALEEAGIERDETYVTNAVKHFKWVPRGKRRLHEKPNRMEIAACKPWLVSELAFIQPEILVCLGATAAQTILGPSVRVLRDRGEFRESEFCECTFVTVHPSSLLRAPDEASREKAFRDFVGDLKKVAKKMR